MILPGTVLGVWNLVGISSQREMASISSAWIQAHGHAQFFGWVERLASGFRFIRFPSFRGSVCCSIPIGWVMWTAGVGTRWFAVVQSDVVPSWFGRKQVNDRMSVYWLISSYPATRRLLVVSGLVTLALAEAVPESLSLREAAEADGVQPEVLVEKLGAFFESRLARSLRG